MTSTSAAVEQPNPTITVPEPLKVEPRRPATRQILAMTLRASISDRSTWRLPVIAFAVISTIILDVTGGAVMMWHIRGDNAAFYRVTSTIAVVLLILPLMTLASSAAKLSARRRDDRLSSLRLIGASAHLLRVMTLAEAGLQALTGAILGILGYLLCVPALGRLSFNGEVIGARSVLLGPVPVIGVIAALVLLALTSSAIGLRRVDVSPLGVRMRSQPTSVSWVRLVVGGIMLLLIVFSRKILGFLGSQAGTIGRDVQTGVMLLILFAFATVACSVGVNQAAAILDRRQVEVGLDVVGMDLTAQDKARRITVLSPMRFAMAIGLIATGLLLIPLVGMALLARPVAVITTVGTILLGAGMVRLGLWSTRPLLGRVLDDGLARTE